MFEIESDIPIPSPRIRYSSKYPWDGMKVGDSFFVPAPDDGATISVIRQRLTNGAWYQARRHGTTHRIRRVPDGVRVWRVE